jgi:hypothetical protein
MSPDVWHGDLFMSPRRRPPGSLTLLDLGPGAFRRHFIHAVHRKVPAENLANKGRRKSGIPFLITDAAYSQKALRKKALLLTFLILSHIYANILSPAERSD